MKEKRKINNDVFIGLFLTVVSGFFYLEASKIHPTAAQFPKIVLGLLFFMSLILMILGVRKTLKPALWLKSDTLLNINVIRTPLLVFVVVAGYLVLMNFTGFFISTVIFVPVCMFFYGVKSIRLIIITNVVLNLFVYILFVRLLRVMLP